ncbi:hypothetical protein Y032_0233g3106 [Ancylostoma ceylanicum]|uniref:Uncharacterized protein n=1 Tax=Ancylostoma ceylanicum TaxID=53326 RepID=A0A016SG13_9BILA|nr:hypothetical protein Y032_0233g3106 [Ancylostoma ceylanicum]
MEITFLVAPEAADEEISSQTNQTTSCFPINSMHKAMPIAFLLLALAMFQTQAYVTFMPFMSGNHTWRGFANWTGFPNMDWSRGSGMMQNGTMHFNATGVTGSRRNVTYTCDC